MIAFFFLGIYGRITAYLPPWCVSLLGALLTKVALATSLRDRVERGMRKFSLKKDYDIEDLAKRHIRFLVDVFHNMLYFRYHRRPLSKVATMIKREGEVYLQEALKKAGKAILVSLHLGDFFCSITSLASVYPTNLMVRSESNPRWESFKSTMMRRCGIKGIYADGGLRQILERLEKGELVLFVIDQYILPYFHGTNHPFREVVPRLALLTEAPVIPFYTLQEGKQIIVRFLPPLEEVSAPRLEETMTHVINENPHLWFWWRRLGKIKRSKRRP
jgi:lauroyl/myristoyl acyltransferase